MAMTTADPSTWGWQPTGFHAPTLQNCIDALAAIYEEEAQTTVLRSATNPIWVLITAAAELNQRSLEMMKATVDNLDPHQAEGAALDMLARINGLNRLPSSKTTCTLRVSGVAGTPVPRGFRASGASGTFVVETVTATVIGSGGTVDVGAQCTTTGPQTVGAVDFIVTPFAGINSVALVADSMTAGRLVETDRQLRVRMFTDRAGRGVGTRDAIEAAIRATEGVQAATVYENLDDRPRVVAGFLSPAHSVQSVIYGTVAGADMAAVLASQVGAGIETAGDVTYDQTIAQGVVKTWRWRLATEVSIEVLIGGLTIIGSDTVAAQTDIAQRITAYINALQVGDDVNLFRIIAAMTASEFYENASSVQLRRAGDSWGSVSLAMGATEKATANVDLTDIAFS